MELKGETIKLRPFRLSDAQEHLAGEDSEQIKWLSGGKSTLENVQNWIKKNQKQWENNGHIFNFAIVDPKNEKLLGVVEANTDYNELDGLEEGDANIAYGLYPHARGKGYATQAVTLIMSFLREKGIKRAVLRIDPENEDSLKIPTRCGFRETEKITTRDNEQRILFVKQLQDLVEV